MNLWGNRTWTIDRERTLFSKIIAKIIISGACQKYDNIPESCLCFCPRCRGEIWARRMSSTLDENINNSGILLYFWFAPETIILAIRGRIDFFRDKKWAKAFFTTIFENSRFKKKLKAKSKLCCIKWLGWCVHWLIIHTTNT